MLGKCIPYVGASPSGKAAGFGPAIRGFESFRPSQLSFPLVDSPHMSHASPFS